MQAPILNKYRLLLLCLAVVSLSSCSVAKYSQNNTIAELQIAQQNTQAAYKEVPKNASENKLAENEITQAPESAQNKQLHKTGNQQKTIKFKRTVNRVVNSSAKSIKKLTPDTRNMVQTAAKKWKPVREKNGIKFRDVLFVIVLLALLALLGGILHNIFGLGFIITAVIVIVLAFFVIWLYIWFENNETYK
jgi:Flp pilus assembly protein TadB